MLSIPVVVSLMGWALGVAFIILLGICSSATSVMLVRASLAEGVRTYDELIRTVLGMRWLRVYQLLMVLSSIGSLIALLMLCGDFVQLLSVQLTHNQTPVNRVAAIVVCSVVAVLPLALMRSLSAMWFTSYLSVVFIAILVGVIITRAASSPIAPGVHASQTTLLDFFQGISIIILSLSSQTSMLPLFREMREKTVSAAKYVSNINAIIVTTTYVAVG